MTHIIFTQQFLQDLTARQSLAWEELYDSYSPFLYGIILRHVPEEFSASVLENTFIDIYQHVHEYQPANERFFTWMYKLTLDSCALAQHSFETLPPLLPEPESFQIALG